MDSPSAPRFTFVTLENILLYGSHEDETLKSFVLILRVGPEDRVQLRISLDAAATLLAGFITALDRLGYVLEPMDAVDELLPEEDDATVKVLAAATVPDSEPTVMEVWHEAIDCAPINVTCGLMLPCYESGVFVRLKPLRGQPDVFYSYAFSPRSMCNFVPSWLECFRSLGFSLCNASDCEEPEGFEDEF